ncbi:MAG: Flp pilus assembly complex ATPase component TadA [Deltaproteobacteria bacterium]|nr:Flp pilus assembly complex ATPase component TadA [Deltaproteobacteria bacterium]
MAEKKRLGELLVEQRIITSEQLKEALEAQKDFEKPVPIGETLIDMGLVTENDLLKALGSHLRVEYINLAESDYQAIDRSLASIISEETCRHLRVVPVFLMDDGFTKQLTIAMSDPLNDEAIMEMERETGTNVMPVLTTSSAVSGGIDKLFEIKQEAFPGEFGLPLVDETIKQVNSLLAKAVQMGASDIHIEPHRKEVHVRLRIDGVLRVVDNFPLPDLSRYVVRIKNMGSEKQALMRIDEKRVPQDGSFARVVGGHTVDFRVSSFPTIYGEKIAIRVLDKDRLESIQRIHDLKMPPAVETKFLKCVKQASGIIIATGPTGSGKSSTLHTAINEINNVGINIVTIEDPVEYHAADYVNQSSLKRQAGFTYTVALRSIMRQDPDAILIGEIRDLETAEIAIQAALTGHLVFTTLHTDDAPGAVVRLVDLGIEQFLVSSTVVSAVNQRLLRKICPYCREEYTPDIEDLIYIGIDKNVAEEIMDNRNKYTINRGKGCKRCYQSGYLGRQGAFEILIVTPPIKKLILERETSDIIAEKARSKEDLNMIFEDGLRLVLKGITTFQELQKIPRGDYALKSIEEIFRVSGDTYS